jgi:hypothetical protein
MGVPTSEFLGQGQFNVFGFDEPFWDLESNPCHDLGLKIEEERRVTEGNDCRGDHPGCDVEALRHLAAPMNASTKKYADAMSKEIVSRKRKPASKGGKRWTGCGGECGCRHLWEDLKPKRCHHHRSIPFR